MKKTGALFIILLFLLLIYPTSACPHHMLLDCKIKEVEASVCFADGTPAKEAAVRIYRPDGSLYAEGKTNEKGIFYFKPATGEGNWKIVAEQAGHAAQAEINLAGNGHKGEEISLLPGIIAGFGYLAGLAGIALALTARMAKNDT
jgi:nickel transport protein